MRRLSPTVLYVITGVLALLLVAYVFAGGKSGNPDRLSGQEISGSSSTDPEKQCGSPETYDLIKRELFRRAAEVRGSGQEAFEKVSAYSVVRMGSPILRSHDEDAGVISCSGALALDLPPGVAVVGGRRTLNANIGYAVQPAADGSGRAVRLTGADAIIALLATIAPAQPEASQATTPAAPTDAAQDTVTEPAAERPSPPPPEREPAARPKPPTASRPQASQETARKPVTPSPPPPLATASPSYNCRYARTRGEIAVCNDAGLASLDRQMASQFNRAMSIATPAQRALLQRTRTSFLSYRDSCRSSACIAGAYRDRMREISDIMAGRWRPN